jgi:hypothetical protein
MPQNDELPSLNYPEAWKMPVKDAIARAAFTAIIPNHPDASVSNATAAYLSPDGQVLVIQFPEPAPPIAPIRIEGIEIYETAWTGGDPLENYNTDLTADPAVGKQLYTINGVTALGVSAHSSSDATGENAAFLTFALKGVEVQVAGGESIDLLIEIAGSMIT